MLEQIMKKIDDIEEGKSYLNNRFDGSYIGDKNKLLQHIFHIQSSDIICYLETYKSALDENKLSQDMQGLKHCLNDRIIFLSQTNREKEILFANIEHIAYIERLYILDKNLQIIFSAHDNMEDITCTIELF